MGGFLLFIIACVITCVIGIKEATEKPVPLENWKNKDLYYKDIRNGVSGAELSRNLRNGKYRIDEDYQEPHRNSQGKIIIENYELYKKDYRTYGALQTYTWVKQGKYNLTPEDREEKERLEKITALKDTVVNHIKDSEKE